MAEQDAGGYHEQGLVIGAHLPERVDLRSLLQSVQDQGARSTCLAFTATVAHEVARRANLELLEDLSEEVLYWGCKQVDGDNEPGTVFSSAASALRQWGQPAEDIWPYDGNRDDTDTSYVPPPGALDPAICYSANMSRIGTSIDDIRYCLANGRAVALGIRLSHGFYEPVDGLIPLPSSEKELTEGHAVLVVGYQDDIVPDRGLLIIRNSWGSEWGDEGYGYLPYAYIELYGGNMWIIDR